MARRCPPRTASTSTPTPWPATPHCARRAASSPIVEPECLIEGDHTIDRCYEVTDATLHAVFDQLHRQGATFEHMILKPNMVISGKDCPEQAGVDEVAEKTLKVLSRNVPASVPGVAFLSGGQTPEQATAHLNAMNLIGNVPWQITFSCARALQDAAIKTWKGEAANKEAAQEAFSQRAKLVSLPAGVSTNPTWKKRRSAVRAGLHVVGRRVVGSRRRRG